MDCSLLGSSIHGIFQARILEWVAISFSKGSSWPRDWTWASCSRQMLQFPWKPKLKESNVNYIYVYKKQKQIVVIYSGKCIMRWWPERDPTWSQPCLRCLRAKLKCVFFLGTEIGSCLLLTATRDYKMKKKIIHETEKENIMQSTRLC